MDKQIEEMAKALLDSKVVIDGLDRAFAKIHGVENSRFEKMARYLVETQGYRKSTDVAREIFAEIERLLEAAKNEWNTKLEEAVIALPDVDIAFGGVGAIEEIHKHFGYLKKKYESDGDKNDQG